MDTLGLSGSLFSDLKQIFRDSTVYGVGSLGVKAIGFLLIPVYTRFLSPADYGVIAVTNSFTAVLSIILALQLPAAIKRFYFDTSDTKHRKQIVGTLWIFLTIFCFILTLLLDRFSMPLFAWAFPEVPFSPYIRLAAWGAALNVMGAVPLALFQVSEKPIIYTLFSMANWLTAIAFTLYLVVVLRAGALGVLWAGVLSGLIMLGPFLLATLRQLVPAFLPSVLKAGLLFSIPIIPHGLASWVLEMSDRVILARYVGLSDIGIYSFGYQLGSIVNLVAIAINFAFVPFLYKSLSKEHEASHARLSRMITYFVLTISVLGMVLAVYMELLIRILAPEDFLPASPIARIVVLGQFFHAIYYCSVNLIFYSKRTTVVPIITMTSGLLNLGMNLLLVPRFGILAAAIATVCSYFLISVLAWFFSLRIYPFPFEYRRIGLVSGCCLTWALLGVLIHLNNIGQDALLKTCLLALFPLALWRIGFFDASEKEVIHRLLNKVKLNT